MGEGGGLINIPSGPSFVRTVNGQKNKDRNNVGTSPTCSVFGQLSVIGSNMLDLPKAIHSLTAEVRGGGGADIHTIWAVICSNSKWAEKH